MSDSDKTAVAALISVILRRKANRIIDVKWLVKNQEYAREIIQLSREQGQHDLNEYASHLEKLMFGDSPATQAQPYTGKPKSSPEHADKSPASSWSEAEEQTDSAGGIDAGKYVGSLR